MIDIQGQSNRYSKIYARYGRYVGKQRNVDFRGSVVLLLELTVIID